MNTISKDQITERIIGCVYKVHNTLGAGFLEKVYENALRIELEEVGFQVRQQATIPVRYHNQIVGEYYADLIIENRIIIEIKAVQNLAKEHEV